MQFYSGPLMHFLSGVDIDILELEGVDVRTDLTNPADVLRLNMFRPKALFCCNLLEHVLEPDRLARHCLAYSMRAPQTTTTRRAHSGGIGGKIGSER